MTGTGRCFNSALVPERLVDLEHILYFDYLWLPEYPGALIIG